MKNAIMALIVVACGLYVVTGCDKNASTASTPDSTGNPAMSVTTKPDNTAVNKVDRNSDTMTPTAQSEDSADIKVTADVRRAVTEDKDLSMNAHNAKIMTVKGAVTLRGVVDTAAEKDAVEAKAKSIGGVTSVDNQLEVKTP